MQLYSFPLNIQISTVFSLLFSIAFVCHQILRMKTDHYLKTRFFLLKYLIAIKINNSRCICFHLYYLFGHQGFQSFIFYLPQLAAVLFSQKVSMYITYFRNFIRFNPSLAFFQKVKYTALNLNMNFQLSQFNGLLSLERCELFSPTLTPVIKMLHNQAEMKR